VVRSLLTVLVLVIPVPISASNVVEITQVDLGVGSAVVSVVQIGERNRVDGAGSVGVVPGDDPRLFSGSATAMRIAGDGVVEILQVGDDNVFAVSADAPGMSIDLSAVGFANRLDVAPASAGASALGAADVQVSVVGDRNDVVARFGDGGLARSDLTLMVTGSDNLAGVEQTGIGSVARLGVLGVDNVLEVDQSASDALLTYGIDGDANTITLHQSVDGSTLDLSHTGNGATLTITQEAQ
jgi:hypothetical protein